MQTGWGNFFSNLVFWVCTLAAKFAFDWFALMKPLETPVRALWHNGWLAPKRNGGGAFMVRTRLYPTSDARLPDGPAAAAGLLRDVADGGLHPAVLADVPCF